MRFLHQLLGARPQRHVLVLLLVVLIVFFDVATGGLMLTPSNAQNLISGNAYVLVLAIGMVMVIVIGQLDLSVGSIAGFVSMSVALLMQDGGAPWWVGLGSGLVLGVLVGCWQGFWLARVGIPGFITTLAGMMIFRGALLWESQAVSVPVPEEFQVLGAGHLPQWGPRVLGIDSATFLIGLVLTIVLVVHDSRRQWGRLRASGDASARWIPITRGVIIVMVVGALTWLFGSGREGTSFPIPGLVLVFLIALYHFVTERTGFGRHLYAVGGNPTAARLSGVRIRRVQFAVMVNMAVLSALAGMMFAGRATAAGPQDGTNWELDAIAAVFIGGAAVGGGTGSVVGAVLGGLVMAVLNNGLLLLGVGGDLGQIIKGFVLLAAVAFDMWARHRGRPSISDRLIRGAHDNQMASPAPWL